MDSNHKQNSGEERPKMSCRCTQTDPEATETANGLPQLQQKVFESKAVGTRGAGGTKRAPVVVQTRDQSRSVEGNLLVIVNGARAITAHGFQLQDKFFEIKYFNMYPTYTAASETCGDVPLRKQC